MSPRAVAPQWFLPLLKFGGSFAVIIFSFSHTFNRTKLEFRKENVNKLHKGPFQWPDCCSACRPRCFNDWCRYFQMLLRLISGCTHLFSQHWEKELSFPVLESENALPKHNIIGKLLSHLLRKHDMDPLLVFASISVEAEQRRQRLLGKRLAEEI